MFRLFQKCVVLSIGLVAAASLIAAGGTIGDRPGWPDWIRWAAPALACACLWALSFPLSRRDRSGRPWRRAWNAGLAVMRRARLRAAPPCLLVLGDSPDAMRRILDHGGLVPPLETRSATGAALGWHFARGAVWLRPDFALAPDADGEWRDFLSELARDRGAAMPRGVLAVLDARTLLDESEGDLRRRAALLRDRLDRMRDILGMDIPVHVVVDRLDLLYGLRTVTGGLRPERLEQPLGACRSDARDRPGEFAEHAIDEAVAALTAHRHRRDDRPASGFGSPAPLQAPEEVARLKKPLSRLCAEAFAPNPYQSVPELRGVFLISSGVAGMTVPPLPAECASFRPCDEPTVPGQPWFLNGLLKKWLPALCDTPRRLPSNRFRRAVAARPALAALFLGTLVLAWSLAFSYRETRDAMRAASDAPARLESRDDLLAYCRRLDVLAERNRRRLSPRLGLDAADALEAAMRRRFCAAYESIAVRPEMAGLHDRTRAAGGGGKAREIGDTLELLIALRRRLDTQPVHHAGETPDLLRRYAQWRDKPEVLATLRSTLIGLERELLDQALDGDAMRWLPDWADSRPDAAPVSTAAAWAPLTLPAGETERRRIRAAWTGAGFSAAKALLENAGDYESGSAGAERREAVLDAYREKALTAWTLAAAAIWRGCRESIGDAEVPVLLRQLAAGEDPVSRMRGMLAENLGPLFAGQPPRRDLAWLFRDAQSAAPAADAPPPAIPEDGLAAWPRDNPPVAPAAARTPASSGEAFVAALRETALLTLDDGGLEMLAAHFGGAAAGAGEGPLARVRELATAMTDAAGAAESGILGEALSPAATYDYLRFLAVRQAATATDRRWRNGTDPGVVLAAFAPGADEVERAAGTRIRQFLSATRGLWRVENGRLENASRDRLAFAFSREFLNYCEEILARPEPAGAQPVEIRLDIETVSVNREAREWPSAVEFRWQDREEGRIVYRNFPAAGAFVWKPGQPAVLSMTLIFPSGRAEWRAGGGAAVADIARRLESGALILSGREFPVGAELLRRLGVETVSVRGRLDNGLEPERAEPRPLPPTPESSIVPGGGDIRRPASLAAGSNAGGLPAGRR